MTSVWLATACIGGFALGFGLRGFLHRNRALKGSNQCLRSGDVAADMPAFNNVRCNRSLAVASANNGSEFHLNNAVHAAKNGGLVEVDNRDRGQCGFLRVEDIHRGKAATAGGFAQLHTARANSAMLEPLARVK